MKPPCPGSAPAREVDADFARLFNDSSRVLWCIAAGIVGNADTAEDVVQEAALIGLDKYPQFHAPAEAVGDSGDPPRRADAASEPRSLSAFSAWMGQIVRYVALNQYRKDRSRKTAPLSEDQRWPDCPDPRRGATPVLTLTPGGEIPDDQQAFDDQVMEALQEIGDVARACLLLRSIECLEYQHIGRLLDIPPGTAMSHVYRARQVLRRRLAEREPKAPGVRGPVS